MDNDPKDNVPADDDGRSQADEHSNFDDPDRLPWLETGDDEYEEGTSIGRTIALVVGLLLLLVLIVGGIYWFQNRDTGLDAGSGEVIAAPEGDYKVKPADPEGRDFEGEGDVAHATAEGRTEGSDGMKGAPAQPSAQSGADGDASAAGSGRVQLGAFAEQQAADSLWTALSSRYDYLTSYKKSVSEATVEGRKIYRLNAVTSDAESAASLCAKLKKSGVSCLIPR